MRFMTVPIACNSNGRRKTTQNRQAMQSENELSMSSCNDLVIKEAETILANDEISTGHFLRLVRWLLFLIRFDSQNNFPIISYIFINSTGNRKRIDCDVFTVILNLILLNQIILKMVQRLNHLK